MLPDAKKKDKIWPLICRLKNTSIITQYSTGNAN